MPIVLQPPFLTMLIVVTAWLMHSFLGPWEPMLRMPLLGPVLMVLGFLFMLWARTAFTSRQTTLFVGQRSSQLVRDGPFRISRNPMYVGVLVSHVGLALWIGTLPLYLTVPIAFLFFNFFHIPHEERMLRESFGEPYLTYSNAVRRWV
ncbi:MAG: isoprenylcysteine carboxylmethyltransferase family protein [Nitrospira sp.]